ncbi:MAG TPA: polysaccharide lyase family 8 super-sandwich domain-containing protein [Actinokineospora sp.]|nr:polysaccharide lyase family 8 super-sandwich domain-containing protein [Actinokineospora sp.]
MDAALPHPSRRRILQLTGSAALLAVAGPVLLPAPAWADTYDSLRATWVGMLTGSGYDPTTEPFATVLSNAGSAAVTARDTMAPTTTSLWPNLPIGTVSANVTSSYNRLRDMALAYALPNTGLTGNVALGAKIATGLDWMHSHAYTPTTTTYDNWWDWEIGAPLAMLDTALLAYGHLTTTQLAAYGTAIDHFVPASRVAAYSGTSTGANRTDLCRVLALRGVIGKNPTLIGTAQSALSPVFPYVLSGDGFYADGSFIQHTYIPYAGTYGVVLLNGLSKMITLFAGTTWAVTDPQVQNVYSAVTTTFAPFIYNGLMMDGVSGRGISRHSWTDPGLPEGDHSRGHSAVSDILRLAASGAVPATQTAAWKSMVKGWLRREYYAPLLGDSHVDIPELARARALLNDATVTAAAEPVGHRLFAMDRSVHRRAGWAAQISTCSARTSYYEHGNGENLRGWHTNNGMLSWWGSTYGNGQYTDAFWPTVDPYLLPGTTVSTKALADGAGPPWAGSRPAATWAGGTTDGTYAAVGQDVRGLQSTLTGKKSWFCLDDSVFCLGAGITCADGVSVQTTVDNRNLGAGNSQTFAVNGTTQPTTLGWSQTFTAPAHMAISGMGAWVFPQGGTVKVKRVARTGAWSNINTGGPNTPVTRNYLSMWFDHGTVPTGATYCYQLMPGATATTAAARAAAPNVTVLANTATVQAISVPSLGLTMANFFAAGTAGPVTADKACSVLIREQGTTMTVVVSDPTRAAATVEVTVAKSGYPMVSAASGITALTTATQVKLLAEVGGTQGAGRTITLSGSGTAVPAATASHLAATASTYVRDGSYAGTNFGGQTTMTVKNTNTANSGYTRRSLLRFDLSGLGTTVRRAVLWVHGGVADSGGAQTTLRAYGLASTAWTETGVTWNTAPALGGALGTGVVGTSADWVGLDVTSAVAAARPSGTVGLAVYEPLGTAGLAAVLNTRLNAVNPPRLQVITTGPA